MKKLKYILYFTAILLSAIDLHAQQLSTYTGTWHYQSNNQLFIVNIWMEGNIRHGHYKMVEFNNGVIGNIIYDSHRDYGNGNKIKASITANESSEYGLTGFIYDNTILGYNDEKRGDFQIKLLPESTGCSPCPITASWKVAEITRGLKVGEEPPFSIPTDIVLTKVN